MIGDIPIVTKVRPAGSRTLHVRFAGDRRAYVVALTGLIARSKHFAPLMEDADTFAKLDILDDGIGVAWPIETKWGRLDLSSSTPRGIAEEQLPMRGADFSKWRKSLGLSLTEAAKLLGVSRRTIMAYLKKNELSSLLPAGRLHGTNTCWRALRAGTNCSLSRLNLLITRFLIVSR
jgi:excisionase family DNA binding protein